MGRPKASLCLIAKGGLARPIIRHVSEQEARTMTQYGWIVLVKESELPKVDESDDGA